MREGAAGSPCPPGGKPGAHRLQPPDPGAPDAWHVWHCPEQHKRLARGCARFPPGCPPRSAVTWPHCCPVCPGVGTRDGAGHKVPEHGPPSPESS